MTWITYEANRIIHLPSKSELIMRSYKIAWNNDSPANCTIIRNRKVYDSRNEDDFRKLKESGYREPVIASSREVHRRYIVDSEELGIQKWQQYDNVAEHFVILWHWYYKDDFKLLFITIDMQTFEKAEQALQSGLGAIRLDELKGMPTDCKSEIYQLLHRKVKEDY